MSKILPRSSTLKESRRVSKIVELFLLNSCTTPVFTSLVIGTCVRAVIFFSTCEHLIAHNGSILVRSHQIKERKLNELPSNLIVFATTSQLVDSISEALKAIKQRYPDKIPDNITTLKHFLPTPENENDFLSYGSASKNVYLLLLEDY